MCTIWRYTVGKSVKTEENKKAVMSEMSKVGIHCPTSMEEQFDKQIAPKAASDLHETAPKRPSFNGEACDKFLAHYEKFFNATLGPASTTGNPVDCKRRQADTAVCWPPLTCTTPSTVPPHYTPQVTCLLALLAAIAPEHTDEESPWATQKSCDAQAAKVKVAARAYAEAMGKLLPESARKTAYFHLLTCHLAEQVYHVRGTWIGW